ncbi:MAG: 4Fe-4S dicluster domain-containing protein [Anaerolineae bacterium]|nr:4Fe-4S dicluster domain-containing protein [Anaerolineae bacterium]
MTQTEDKTKAKPGPTRRDFLRGLVGTAGAAAVVTGPTRKVAAATVPLSNVRLAPSVIGEGPVDPLERMRAELARALEKPVDQRRWVMVIDLRKCVGCHSCTVSCVAENHLPPGVVYRPVIEEEIGTFPNVSKRFLPRPCMQCEEPPCVDVCPVGATWQREDGITEIDYEQCIGCRYCLSACPYNARTFDRGLTYVEASEGESAAMVGAADAGTYELAAAHEYGEEWPRDEGRSPVGNARKCHFCLHRLEKGMLPACTTTCMGRATYFGDANDPDSLVAELIASPNVMRLKEELGTKPRVYYLA